MNPASWHIWAVKSQQSAAVQKDLIASRLQQYGDVHYKHPEATLCTSSAPRTPASSMVSRFAAASTVSSVSQPPCRRTLPQRTASGSARIDDASAALADGRRTLGNTMPLPPCALISSTRALSGPLFAGSILTGMHLQRVVMFQHCGVLLGGPVVCQNAPQRFAHHAHHICAPGDKALAVWRVSLVFTPLSRCLGRRAAQVLGGHHVGGAVAGRPGPPRPGRCLRDWPGLTLAGASLPAERAWHAPGLQVVRAVSLTVCRDWTHSL